MLRALPPTADPRLRVVVLSWRDSGHPEGGGSEQYAERVATGLVAMGYEVTVLTARYPGALAEEQRDGFRILRAGGRFTVYLRALLRLLLRRAGRFDVVVDVQNGTPFFARLVTRRPVVVLCHHVHREQWGMALGGTRSGRVIARVGWWVESHVAPRLYRGCRYVTVSRHSAEDLVGLGVRRKDITVVHNGAPAPRPGVERAATPEIVVLGRLVPHKQVEHALRAVADLSSAVPDLHLTVVGQGWWENEIRAEVDRLGLTSRVLLTGFVDEDEKHELLSRAWVLVTPSVKEGWGLSVIEAAAHGTPSVAYRSAGGVAESIVHGVTGFLADDRAELTRQIHQLLSDEPLRVQMGAAAQEHASHFTWSTTAAAFARVLCAAAGVPSPVTHPAVIALPRPTHPLDDSIPARTGVPVARSDG